MKRAYILAVGLIYLSLVPFSFFFVILGLWSFFGGEKSYEELVDFYWSQDFTLAISFTIVYIGVLAASKWGEEQEEKFLSKRKRYSSGLNQFDDYWMI
jgi:hypothetical protein